MVCSGCVSAPETRFLGETWFLDKKKKPDSPWKSGFSPRKNLVFGRNQVFTYLRFVELAFDHVRVAPLSGVAMRLGAVLRARIIVAGRAGLA